MKVLCVIPARYASTRLPGKPLKLIVGKPMIQWVYEQAVKARTPFEVLVATDDKRVFDAVESFGGKAMMTRADHPSGTDRLAEVAGKYPDVDVVVNVQGDEPLMDPAWIDEVAELLSAHTDASMGTAAHAIASQADYLNPNVVKVVLDARNMAHYFSRAPIPWSRDQSDLAWWHEEQMAPAVRSASAGFAPLRHVGIYSYRAGFLRQFPLLPPAPTEAVEALEQLRALWHGHRIAVHIAASAPGPGVDTPEDLEKVRAIVALQGQAH